ncbi:uncharacterized protein LOC130450783 [Diorhabda sublineata]|uniref:uncharacterized protein LOC130450783 n=1 Tax=Diorhabda sublineata TaxID=1163346 RepID=UPI0024E11463|nr:uncharacterized protein LOC130450783 [Diorhabda sublineata]
MMAHGLNSVIKRTVTSTNCKSEGKGIGSRRIFAPHFKLQVLDSYRNDGDCKGNQRATARKYGIHRRQIQKWLQVENTLRNSVSKEKSECLQVENIIRSCISKEKSECATETKICEFELTLNVNRQRDDDMFSSGVEARVPALTQSPLAPPYAPPRPLPLDFTTRSRGSDHTSPNVARPESPRSPLDPATPIDLSFKRPTSMTSAPVLCSAAPLTPPVSHETGQCIYFPMSNSPSEQYHPDIWDLSTKSLKRKSPSPVPVISPKPVKLFKPYLDDIKEPEEMKEPACCSASLSPCDTIYYNNVCDIKSDYSSSYTLHELQPNSAINYYYYPPYTSSTEFECNGYCCEDISYGQNLAPLKHRQSYSLDFKLSAIDCYYQDSICKGNQRAVASKYNIHRRQVQKWLKQAEELRHRNESMKQIHAVR